MRINILFYLGNCCLICPKNACGSIPRSLHMLQKVVVICCWFFPVTNGRYRCSIGFACANFSTIGMGFDAPYSICLSCIIWFPCIGIIVFQHFLSPVFPASLPKQSPVSAVQFLPLSPEPLQSVHILPAALAAAPGKHEK